MHRATGGSPTGDNPWTASYGYPTVRTLEASGAEVCTRVGAPGSQLGCRIIPHATAASWLLPVPALGETPALTCNSILNLLHEQGCAGS